MAHLFRFFVEKEAVGPSSCTITGDEHTHLSKILRLKEDTLVEVFDGQGFYGEGRISAISSKTTTISLEKSDTAELPSRRICLGVGILKPHSIDEILPPLSEIGIDEVHFFLQEHVSKDRLSSKVQERWQRICINSAKQCKRPYLLKIQTWTSFSDFVAFSKDFSQKIYFCPIEKIKNEKREKGTESLIGIVGGEKGLSLKEEEMLWQAGFTTQKLGPYIQRATTAVFCGGFFLVQEV